MISLTHLSDLQHGLPPLVHDCPDAMHVGGGGGGGGGGAGGGRHCLLMQIKPGQHGCLVEHTSLLQFLSKQILGDTPIGGGAPVTTPKHFRFGQQAVPPRVHDLPDARQVGGGTHLRSTHRSFASQQGNSGPVYEMVRVRHSSGTVAHVAGAFTQTPMENHRRRLQEPEQHRRRPGMQRLPGSAHTGRGGGRGERAQTAERSRHRVRVRRSLWVTMMSLLLHGCDDGDGGSPAGREVLYQLKDREMHSMRVHGVLYCLIGTVQYTLQRHGALATNYAKS